MESFVEAYRRKSELTITSILLCLLGVATIIWMQTITVTNLTAFLELAPEKTKQLILEWFMNLASGGSLIAMSGFWIGAVFKSDYYYDDESEIWISRITYLITGLFLLAFGTFFLHYIWANLIFLVVVAAIGFVALNSKK